MKKKQFFALTGIFTKVSISMAFIMTIAFSIGLANGQLLDKRVSISLEKVGIEDFLANLQDVADVKFVYSPSVIPLNEKVSPKFEQQRLSEVLSATLSDFGVGYKEMSGQLVLFKHDPVKRSTEKEDLNTPKNSSKAIMLSGKITNNMGLSIPGATIILKGTNIGVTSDNDGNFRFSIPDDHEGGILLISFIGFKTQEVKIGNQSIFEIILQEDVGNLSEVVVNGYSEIRRDSYTGTTITISGEDLKRTNPTNILAAIQLFDPSFRVSDNNALGSNPNALPEITVRGSTGLPSSSSESSDGFNVSKASMLNNPNLPTFILDGFQVSIQTVFDLNYNRIASITLLKDAAAAAVYGSRAANGVVVITTNPPEEGKIHVTYTSDITISGPDLTVYNLLNAEEKLEYERLAGLYNTSTNSNGNSQNELDLLYYQKKKNVVSGVDSYWLSEPVETSIGNSQSIYIEGGSNTLLYGVTGRYQNMKGVMKGSERNRYGGDLTLSYNLKDKITFYNQLSITATNSQESPYGSFSNYARMNPYYPKTDDNGNILQAVDSWQRRESSGTRVQDVVLNPAYNATLSNSDIESYTQIINSFSTVYRVTPSLRMQAQISLNRMLMDRDRYQSPFSNEFYSYIGDDLKRRGRYDYAGSNETSIDGNFVVSYTKVINKTHFLNASLGGNLRDYSSEFKSFAATGFISDRFTNISFANRYEENASPNGDKSIERLIGVFANINYSIEDKYLFDLATRIDGSSKFGTENKYAPFWAAGIGWNMHNEGFLSNSSYINRLTIRATTGVTGEVSFPSYMSKTTYEYRNEWYSTGVGAVSLGYGNESLKWQKTHNYDLGVEVSLLKNRIYFLPRYYYRQTEDVLADIIVPTSVGFGSYKANLGVMENKGFEMMLRSNVIQGAGGWYVGLFANIAQNRNTIKKISESLKKYNDEVDNDQGGAPLLRFREGESLNTIYAVPSLGIDPENGKELYVKKDGTITYIYDAKDNVPVGDKSPKIDGTFGANISYKNFFLSVNFYTKLGGDLYNQTLVDRVENADPRYNADRRVLSERWQKPGDVTFFKDVAIRENTFASSRFLQSDNAIELRSANLSYESFGKLAKDLKMESLRFTVTMNDIWRWAPVRLERGIEYPFARMVTFSVQARF
ncbi:SusC/RagA family TonB-linked outer membrane protein [Belliella sp. DSM 111904]|uniref:SusC/RagA family TonB-linked outer membrane protein n=1 Tax=Belliella filtrata TaxID=2923435 RepID=A0ABS9V4S2_9BACT|nr:SusC/RagA family TonB-linked outer membrane protein [Belliella filtrata]MCH7411393.1 SusC/RagA family TonB-linked outer membrane protein [Belliella filtrata]